MSYDLIGYAIGLIGIGYGIFSDYNARKERIALHGFLKGLKTGVLEKPDHENLIKAIDDEMGRLIPPKKKKDGKDKPAS